MEEEADRSGWGPQPPRKHQPPVMSTQVCGCSSPIHVAQGQPRQRPRVHHHFLSDLFVLFKLAQKKSRLRREGKTRVGQGSFARDLISAMVLLSYKLQSPTFSWWNHSLGPASHAKILEA